MSAHGDAMAKLVASIRGIFPDHAILLIVAGEDCGADLVGNVPPFEQLKLLELCIKTILSGGGDPKETVQ